LANTIEIVIRQTSSGNAITSVTKDLGKLDKVADNSGGTLSKLTGIMGGMGKIALGVGAGGVLAIGAALVKATTTGLSFNNAMEQASAKINAFTKDAGLTADILETVQERAAKTPFAFEEMANSAAALMPTVRASGESLEFLLEKAEILAASNPMEGLEGASFALKEAVSGDFTSIIERFNLSRQTLNNLKDQGVPAMEAVGIAMAELGLDTDLVTALANTAQGRWSTFQDTLTTLAGTVTQPIFDTLSQSLGGINDWLVQIGPQLEAFATMLAGRVADAIATVQAAIQGFQSGGTGGLLAALGFGPETLEFINSSIAYIVEQFTQLSTVLAPSLASLQESFARLSLVFGEAGVNTGSLTQFLIAQANFILGTVIPAWIQWIGFLTGVAAAAFSAWVSYIQTAQAAWQGLTGFIQSSVIPVLLSINAGLSPVVDLLVAFGEVINAVINKALQAMAGLWQNVLGPALKRVGETLQNIIMPSLTSVGATVKGDVSPVLRELGDTVLPVLNQGLELINEAIQRTISFFNSLKETVNSFSLPDVLTPGSPPPMAYALMDIASGADRAAAAIKGMQKSLVTNQGNALRFIDDLNMGGIAKSHLTGGGQWKQFRKIIKGNILANMQGLADGTVDILGQITQVAAQFNFPPSMAAEFAKSEGLIDHLTGSFAKFKKEIAIENLGNMAEMAGSFSGLGSVFADMLGPKADKAKDRIALLQDFISGKTQGVDIQGPFGVMKNMLQFQQDGLTVSIDKNLAQKELNQLLVEQAKQEEMITKQKESQQKLDFLRAQLDLLKLGQGLGGNIFQGITFGLNASVEDLLAATNAVTEAMINQIDQDLQIASPSKVMFNKFKNQVGGAMVSGLAAVKPMLERVAGPMLDPLTGGGASNSKVTNNYFNQTVNTRADSSSVVGDFRTMQLMAGA
jgi:hypothetical protein